MTEFDTSQVNVPVETAIKRVAEIHERIIKLETTISILPELKNMLTAVIDAQSIIARAAESNARSAESMANTFRMTEERYARMEERHEALAEIATGKDQLPLKSHYWTLFAALMPTIVMSVGVVVGVLYVTKYDINATLTTLELNQHRTQALIEHKIDDKK